MAYQVLPWSAFKETKNANPTQLIYYLTELEYKSSNPEDPDICRYFMILTISGVEYQCLITIVDPAPPGSDLKDWEDNYMPGAIEM